MGRWIDFENDYKTLDPGFMESVWWVFGELYKKGLVYKGFKVDPTLGAASHLQLQSSPLALNMLGTGPEHLCLPTQQWQ